jgi:hypothetical protein
MKTKSKRVILGRAVWHATDEEMDSFTAATRCRIHGRQLQMTTAWGDELDGKRMCLRCARILGGAM